MATVYHRDQAGAPAVYSTSAYDVAQFTNFKEVLKACLVFGYGATPAAGWVLIAEGTNHIVLRNGSHSGYVCFTWYTGGVMRVWVADTFDGVDGAGVIIGAGRKTGIAANNGTAHAISLTYFSYSATTSSWYMVADERTFIFSWVANSSVTPMTSSVPTNFPFTIYVGEDTQENFIAVGGQLTNTVLNGDATCYFGSGCGLTSLRNPSTGLLVDTGSLSFKIAGIATTANTGIPSDNDTPISLFSQLTMGRAGWYVSNYYCGQFRGIAVSPELFVLRHGDAASSALSGLGMNTREAARIFDLGDGHNYFLRPGSVFNSMFLVTDNPGYW
jgi:hypothetical protein